jgi:branched-chain amino acid transport system substrate-binding protein
MRRALSYGTAGLACALFVLLAALVVRSFFRPRGTVTVVSILPRSGPDRAWSEPIVRGIRLALEEHGMAAGWCRIRYEDWDYAESIDRVLPLEAALKRTARRAVDDPDVLAVLGPFDSAAARVLVPVLHEARLLCISPGEADPAFVRPPGPVNYFRVATRTDALGAEAARRAKALGAKRVFVLRDGERPFPDSAPAFCEAAGREGLAVVGGEGLGAKPDAALWQLLLGTQADLVYFSGLSARRFGTFAIDASLAGYKGDFMISERAMSASYIDAAGPASLRTTVVFGVEPAPEGFERKYRELYQVRPGVLAYYGYLAGHAVLEAIANADARERDVIRASGARLPYFDARGDLAPDGLKTWTVQGLEFGPE